MKKHDTNDRDSLTDKIIGACYKVHNELGPGFVERIYLNALIIALEELNLSYATEKEFPVYFQPKGIGKFRADLVVENRVIVELKALEAGLPKIFESQVLSYLKASKLKVGLLINFGSRFCKVRRLMLSL